MRNEKILELYRKHDYMTLEEEGFLTIGMVKWAYSAGAISKEELEELGKWFY